MMNFSSFDKNWWFFKIREKMMIFQKKISKIIIFSNFVKKWWFLKMRQKMMIFQILAKKWWFLKFALLKLFSKTLVSANLLVKWLMLYVAFNVSTYVVCWMFFVGFQCCDICRDIGQSTLDIDWVGAPIIIFSPLNYCLLDK